MGHIMAIDTSSSDAARREPADAIARDPLGEPPLLAAANALLLDFDGTLVALAPRPDGVRVDPGLPDLLQRLQYRLGGAFAIVTGRLLQDVEHRLAPLKFLGAGLHGAQLRLDPSQPAPVPRDEQVEKIARELVERLRNLPQVLVEDKGGSVAVHFRQAPAAAAECRAVVAAAIRDIPALELLEGHCVVEARRRGSSKEAAVEALCAQAPLLGRLPVVLGDDRTDEDAFRAALRHGGFGVRVGPDPTQARYRLAGVEAVHAWLRASLEALA